MLKIAPYFFMLLSLLIHSLILKDIIFLNLHKTLPSDVLLLLLQNNGNDILKELKHRCPCHLLCALYRFDELLVGK